MRFRLLSFASALAGDATLPLSVRIYRLICLTTGLLCLGVILPVNVGQNLPVWVNVGVVALGGFALFCLRESLRGRDYFVGFFLALLVILDGVWFFNGGSAGSVTFFFFPAVLYPVAVLRGRARWGLALLLGLNLCLLLILDFAFPQLATPFVRPLDRVIDLVTGAVCSGLAVVLVLWLTVETYNREHARVVSISRDLATSELRLRLALHSSRQAWFEIDLVTGQAQVGENPDRVGRLKGGFKFTLAEWRDRLHPDDRATADAALARCGTEDGSMDVEYRLQAEPHGWRWLRTVGRGVEPDAAGKPRRIVGAHRDVTLWKDLGIRLLQAQRREAVGLVAGGVAHHVNNILTPMLLGAEMLRDKLHAPDDRDCIHTITSGTQRVSAIISELLAYTHKTVAKAAPADMRLVLRGFIEELREKFPSTIEVVERVAPDLWPLAVDPAELRSMLIELCINAREAMPRGGTFQVVAANEELPARSDRVDATAQGGRFVRISVEDTGCGVRTENLTRLFDPFFTTKPVGHGPGLGLTTVSGLVHAWGGAVRVSSELDKGTTFHVLLPAATSRSETDLTAANFATEGPGSWRGSSRAGAASPQPPFTQSAAESPP